MTEEVKQEEAAVEAVEAPGLNINDLAFMLKMIDVVTERGGFRGGELANVGAIRNKLEAFLRANVPTEEAESTGDDDAE